MWSCSARPQKYDTGSCVALCVEKYETVVRRKPVRDVGGQQGVMTRQMTLEICRVKMTQALSCRHLCFKITCEKVRTNQSIALVFAWHGTRAAVFVYACACTSCRDLVTVACLSVRPAGLEEAAVVLLVPLEPPSLKHLFPAFMSTPAEQRSPQGR